MEVSADCRCERPVITSFTVLFCSKQPIVGTLH